MKAKTLKNLGALTLLFIAVALSNSAYAQGGPPNMDGSVVISDSQPQVFTFHTTAEFGTSAGELSISSINSTHIVVFLANGDQAVLHASGNIPPFANPGCVFFFTVVTNNPNQTIVQGTIRCN